MSRPIRVILITIASAALAAAVSACGTERISVRASDPTHSGAVLFSQRCSGCHTLSYAATHGSATNVRSALITNGPNFNVRCERPVTRVLYAIENGGFSGAIMPQNVVVGQDARLVAEFVSQYAGRQAQRIPGQTPCTAQSIGTLPPPGQSATVAAGSAPSGRQSIVPASGSVSTAKPGKAAKRRQHAKKRKTARR